MVGLYVNERIISLKKQLRTLGGGHERDVVDDSFAASIASI